MYAYYMEILFLPGKRQLGSCQAFALNFPNKKMGESKQRVESWKWRSKCGTTQSLPQWNIHIHGGTLADLHRKCDTFQRWELVQQQGQHTLAMQKHPMLQLLTLAIWVVCCPGQPSWISFKTWPLPGFQHLFFLGGSEVWWSEGWVSQVPQIWSAGLVIASTWQSFHSWRARPRGAQVADLLAKPHRFTITPSHPCWKGGMAKMSTCHLSSHFEKKNAPCDFPGKITSTSAPNPPPKKMNHLFFSKTQYIFTTRLPHPPVLLLAKSDLEHCVDPPER